MDRDDGLTMDNWKWQRNATDPRDDILCTCPAANDPSMEENRGLAPFDIRQTFRENCKVLPPIKRSTHKTNLKDLPDFTEEDMFTITNGCSKINSSCYRALSEEAKHETVCSALRPRLIRPPKISTGQQENVFSEHARSGFKYWFDEKKEKGKVFSCGKAAKRGAKSCK